MNGLDADQLAFRDATAKLAADLAAHWQAGRNPAETSPPEPSAADWSRIAAAGWLGLRLREENGGAGADAVYAGLLVEQLARHAVAAPVLGTLIAAEQLQAHGAPPDLLSDISSGAVRVAPLLRPDLAGFADGTDNADADLAGFAYGADLAGSADSANGALAWDSAGADFAVSVTDGTAHPLAAPRRTLDLTRAIRVPLAGGAGGAGGSGRESISCRAPAAGDAERLRAFALAMLTADLLGTMEAAHAAAVEHARTRVQFGVPVGAFQAVKQLAADGLVLVEASRSAMWYAAWAVDALPPPEALRAARVAKSFASRSAVEVCESVLQVFGGIGFTWESRAHRWLRRAHASRRAFGDEHHHEAVLAAQTFGEP